MRPRGYLKVPYSDAASKPALRMQEICLHKMFQLPKIVPVLLIVLDMVLPERSGSNLYALAWQLEGLSHDPSPQLLEIQQIATRRHPRLCRRTSSKAAWSITTSSLRALLEAGDRSQALSELCGASYDATSRAVSTFDFSLRRSFGLFSASKPALFFTP